MRLFVVRRFIASVCVLVWRAINCATTNKVSFLTTNGIRQSIPIFYSLLHTTSGRDWAVMGKRRFRPHTYQVNRANAGWVSSERSKELYRNQVSVGRIIGALSAWFRYDTLCLLNRRYELIDRCMHWAMLEILKLMRMGNVDSDPRSGCPGCRRSSFREPLLHSAILQSQRY